MVGMERWKLIAVAPPLEAIKEEAARETSIRHGQTDPGALARQMQALDEGLSGHLARDRGLDRLEIMVEVPGDNSKGFSESLRRTTCGNSLTRGYEDNEFRSSEL